MDFFVDFGLFAILVVGATAFMGIISALLGEGIAGKKKNSIYDQDSNKRTGWKKVERKVQ